MDWCSRYLFCIVLFVLIKMSSSEVKVAKDDLTWRKANDACSLISFPQVKSEQEIFLKEMEKGSSYWIKDLVEEFSVIMIGCQMAVNILTSKQIENNLLLNCFQFCQDYNIRTIGIKENNCSCFSTNVITPSSGDCDVLCVWEDRSCKTTKTFSVFQKKAYANEFGGYRLEECILIQGIRAFKSNCSSKEKYLCQNNGKLNSNSKAVTWTDAVSKCAEENQMLASYPPKSSIYNNFGTFRYWIGTRQYFLTKPVQQGSSMCSAIRRDNDDIRLISVNCEEENKYICLEDKK